MGMNFFEKNIGALRPALGPEGVATLMSCRAAGPRPDIEFTRRGQPFFRVTANGRTTNVHSPVNPSVEARKLLSFWLEGGEDTLLLLGLGCGYLLEALAAAPRLPSRIIVVERDPAPLAAGLAHFDVSALPARADLLLLIGDTAAPAAISAITPPLKIVPYPALYVRDETYYSAFARHALARERRAAPPGGRLRIQVIKHPFMFDNVFETLKGMGHDPEPALPGLELGDHFMAAKPDVVFSLNYYPSVAVTSRGLGIPYACLCIDSLINETLLAPHSAWDGNHIFTFDRKDVLKFRGAGHPNVFHMPLGADTRTFHPAPRGALPDMAVSFVGNSIRSSCNEYRQSLMPNLYARIGLDAHSGSNDYREALLPQMERISQDPASEGQRRVMALCRDACEVVIDAQDHDPFVYRIPEIIAGVPALQAALGGVFSEADITQRLPAILSKEASMRKRIGVVSAVARRRPITVYGDAGWREVFADNPNVSLFSIIPYSRCASVYNATRVNLNVARTYAADPAAQRVFDVIACGAFLLSERTADLCDLFEPDIEVGVFSSYGELCEKLDYFLDNPGARAAAADRAHRKLLEAHTLEHRLASILKHVAGK
jgi:spore maturation protein CgeB